MRVAIVRDGVVDNVLEAPSMTLFSEPPWVEFLGGAVPVQVLANQTAAPGFTYDPERSPQFQPPVSQEDDDGSDQP